MNKSIYGVIETAGMKPSLVATPGSSLRVFAAAGAPTVEWRPAALALRALRVRHAHRASVIGSRHRSPVR